MHAAANYKTAFSVATPKAAATCQAAWMYGVSGKKQHAICVLPAIVDSPKF
jgi:hypothetical protein